MVAFHLWGFPIYRYGIFYGITFFCSYIFLLLLIKKQVFVSLFPSVHKILSVYLDDIFLYAVLGVIVGGRLGHIFIYDFSYYVAHPIEIIMVWKGGMSFIGGILGVISALSIFILKNNIRVVDLFALGDILFIPTAFGIMIGRIGNFLNQELYGLVVPDSILANYPKLVSFLTKIDLFYVYNHIDSYLRINTNFLSSFFEGFVLLSLLLIVFFLQLKHKKWKPGLMVGIFLVGYSIFRFLFEYIRADSQLEFVGWFTKSQRFFLSFAVLGVLFLLTRKRVFAKQ